MNKLIAYVTKLLKVRKVSTAVIMTTGLLAAVIIFITIYATQVGNFIIKVDSGDYQLFLSETKDFKSPESLLNAVGVKDMKDTTLDRIDIKDLKSKDGSNNDNARTYLAYTFYIQNQGNLMINYNIRFAINEVFKEVDQAVWIFVSEEREGFDENYKIYARRQTEGDRIGEPEDCLAFRKLQNYNYDFDATTPFLSDITIFDYNVEDMRSNEIIKYTFIMWLEGEDAQCVNARYDGSIRMELLFSAYR